MSNRKYVVERERSAKQDAWRVVRRNTVTGQGLVVSTYRAESIASDAADLLNLYRTYETD